MLRRDFLKLIPGGAALLAVCQRPTAGPALIYPIMPIPRAPDTAVTVTGEWQNPVNTLLEYLDQWPSTLVDEQSFAAVHRLSEAERTPYWIGRPCPMDDVFAFLKAARAAMVVYDGTLYLERDDKEAGSIHYVPYLESHPC